MEYASPSDPKKVRVDPSSFPPSSIPIPKTQASRLEPKQTDVTPLPPPPRKQLVKQALSSEFVIDDQALRLVSLLMEQLACT